MTTRSVTESQAPAAPPGTSLPARPRGRGKNVRWGIAVLCFGGLAVNYLDRSTLSVALPSMSDDLHIGPETQGFILSAFFFTYALCQLPAGALLDKYGVKRVFAIGAIWWSVATVGMGLVRGVGSLVGARMLLGAGEAAGYPAPAKAVSRWFPRHERTLANSVWDNGARVGTAIALPLVTMLVSAFHWRVAFIACGLLGFLWIIGWWRLYHEPADHPKLTAEERAYIEAGGAHTDETAAQEADAPKVRWRDLFRYRTVWGMMLGFFCLNYVIYFFITWFPSYLVDERGFDLLKLGFFGTVPGLVAIFGSLLGGFTADRLLRKGWSTTKVRKTCLVSGTLCSSVIALTVVVPTASGALALLSLSYASLTFSTASVASLPADVAPTAGHVASLAGIQNFASNVAGILGPIVTGFLLASSGGSYLVPLLVSGALSVVGALTYAFVIKRVEPLPVR
ncbi:MFS transporter [Streptomyces sp. NPDC056121]|uniref:MFS transporter n=1 Tax=unclassified Streptomyces TaxID=2593676 RepID=UPI00225AF03F|nr:MFS transporter [Streptomyces sp. NBC_00401]MCX5080152.1 MFS transporter [Streptomyces sp. NBC_00401]